MLLYLVLDSDLAVFFNESGTRKLNAKVNVRIKPPIVQKGHASPPISYRKDPTTGPVNKI